MESQWRILARQAYEELGGDPKDAVDRPLKGGTLEAAVDDILSGETVLRWLGKPGEDIEKVQCGERDSATHVALEGPGEPAELASGCERILLSLVRRPSGAGKKGRSTLMPLPNPFVVPGGRFREQYYWDSYFGARGLALCGWSGLARGLVDNMVVLTEQCGFPPNGSRTYYANRSQPPLLSAAVRGAGEVSSRSLAALEREHARLCTFPHCLALPCGREVFRFYAQEEVPRAEAIPIDERAAEGLPAGEAKALWREIASTCASGWDFSSRFMKDGALRTTAVAACDLLAFVMAMERDLASICSALSFAGRAEKYARLAAERQEALNALFWDSSMLGWRDGVLAFDKPNGQARLLGLADGQGVYASNWVPLWCGAAEKGSRLAEDAVRGLEQSGLLQEGGPSCSNGLSARGEQWDWPNVWPPLVLFLAEGALDSGAARGEAVARRVAEPFLRACLHQVRESNALPEKFNALCLGSSGGGGEYAPIQDGFEWTAGTGISLIHRFEPKIIEGG